MSDSAPATPDSTPQVHASISPPALLLWLAIQIAALALAAARAPLFAEYPQPGEFHAVTILITVQWLAIAMLFPVLWQDWRAFTCIAVSGLVMLLFAGALSATSLAALAPTALYMTLFMLAVFVMSTIPRLNRSKLILSAVITTLSFGAPLLAYLREDLGNCEIGAAKWKGSPFFALIKNPQNPAKECWILLAIVITLSLLIRFLQSRRIAQQARRTP